MKALSMIHYLNSKIGGQVGAVSREDVNSRCVKERRFRDILRTRSGGRQRFHRW